MKIECLQNECNRLAYLLREAEKEGIIPKIQNELTNVSNQLRMTEGLNANAEE
jgi:hypothetical protein